MFPILSAGGFSIMSFLPRPEVASQLGACSLAGAIEDMED
jgi:hypothetical protein